MHALEIIHIYQYVSKIVNIDNDILCQQFTEKEVV